nr:MAG TPA: hypothetical protein [Caudoviricetes sp.]
MNYAVVALSDDLIYIWIIQLWEGEKHGIQCVL